MELKPSSGRARASEVPTHPKFELQEASSDVVGVLVNEILEDDKTASTNLKNMFCVCAFCLCCGVCVRGRVVLCFTVFQEASSKER